MAVEVLDIFDFLILVMSSMCVRRVTVTVLPPFRPTEYLLEMKIGTKPWHSFAWACREIMCEYSGLEKGPGS
jgi:hypothetical protein